jgi:flagellar assembly protein FliH
MLSKIRRGEASLAAKPQVLRSVGNTRGPEMVSLGTPASEEVSALRARVAELQAALETRVRDAREAGRREGEAAGRDQAAAQLKPAIEQLARSIRELADLRPRLRGQAEGDLVRLALAIARRVLHRELSIDSDAVGSLAKSALDKLRLQEISRVRIHPPHRPAIEALLAASGECAHIELKPDISLPPGGIVFETTRGEFDSSIEIRLKEIERGLTDRLPG